ncbi:MAG TPA: hypothetical protein DCR55_14130 [Lentisphaeria bacterium]|nr:hypothetical protein [Lentisphaeria bacterium]
MTIPKHGVLLAVLSVAIIVFPVLITGDKPSPVLPATKAVLFLPAAFLLRCSLALSVFVRAHKEEPLMVASLILRAGPCSIPLRSAQRMGFTGIGMAYMIASLLRIPASFVVCRKAWRRYHAIPSDEAPVRD